MGERAFQGWWWLTLDEGQRGPLGGERNEPITEKSWEKVVLTRGDTKYEGLELGKDWAQRAEEGLGRLESSV